MKYEGDNQQEKDETDEHQHDVQTNPHVVNHHNLRAPPLRVHQSECGPYITSHLVHTESVWTCNDVFLDKISAEQVPPPQVSGLPAGQGLTQSDSGPAREGGRVCR